MRPARLTSPTSARLNDVVGQVLAGRAQRTAETMKVFSSAILRVLCVSVLENTELAYRVARTVRSFA